MFTRCFGKIPALIAKRFVLALKRVFCRVHPVFGHGSEESSSIVPISTRVKAYNTGLTIIKRFAKTWANAQGLAKPLFTLALSGYFLL